MPISAPRHQLALAAVILPLILLPSTGRAHDEPPKTPAERQDLADRAAVYAAAGARTQQMFVTRRAQGDTAESLLLTNTFDRAGRHLEQDVVDPAQAQQSRSRYASNGNWVAEETWRDGKLCERDTFTYDAQGLVTAVVSEDLEAGTREELRYAASPGGDVIVATKLDAGGATRYTITYRYEPGSGRARLVEAEQREGDGSLRVRTRQTWVDGRRRTKDVYGADGSLTWSFTYEYTPAGDFAQITRSGPDGALVSRQIHTWRPDRLPDTMIDYAADGSVARAVRYAYTFFTAGP